MWYTKPQRAALSSSNVPAQDCQRLVRNPGHPISVASGRPLRPSRGVPDAGRRRRRPPIPRRAWRDYNVRAPKRARSRAVAVCGAHHGAGDKWGRTITATQPRQRRAGRRGTAGLILPTVAAEPTLTSRAYDVLRKAIAAMPIYEASDEDCRLDERALAEGLGISRTPVREALLRLENEGVVRTVPRKGIYVVRKTKEEIIEVILASAGLEAMAARLAAERATDAEIKKFTGRFPQFGKPTGGRRPPIPLNEYSELNLDFHQQLVELAHSELFSQLISRLQIHMRAIRHRTIGDEDRMAHSKVDHAHIIEALEARDADAVETRARQHALDLAEHVRLHVSHLK